MLQTASRNSLVVALIIIVLAPSFALAASGGLVSGVVPCGNDTSSDSNTGQPCTVCDLSKLANNIVTDAIYIAVFLCAVLFAWAGFKMLTSGGNEHQRTEAKAIFTNVAIGLVIILVSWLLVDTLIYTLTGSHTWSQICS